MIVPGKIYSRPFEIVRDNSLVNADSSPSLVLWRNGAATLVPVTPTTTANAGKYYLSFTADPAWQATDDLEVFGSAVIAGKQYTGTVWSSFCEPDGKAVIATAVIESVVANTQPAGSVGYILHALSTMIEYVAGFWRFGPKAVEVITGNDDRNEIF